MPATGAGLSVGLDFKLPYPTDLMRGLRTNTYPADKSNTGLADFPNLPACPMGTLLARISTQQWMSKRGP
jgi:hypothetical protein